MTILSSNSSPTTDIDIIDPILERFTDEPALVYSSPPGDDDSPLGDDEDDDDDLFYLKSDNDEWKKLLYGDSFNDTHSENDKTKDYKNKDSKAKSLTDELEYPESSVLLPQLPDSDSTLPEESSESSNEDFSILLFPPQGQRNSERVKLVTHTKTSASREATRVYPISSRFPMILKTVVLVFNPPITRFPISFMVISWEILNPDHIKDISQSLDKAITHCTSRDYISTKLYEILIRAIMARHIFSYKNEDFINGQGLYTCRNLDLEHYWSASQVMDHGPRGSVHMTISICRELTIDDNQVKPEYQQQYNATRLHGRSVIYLKMHDFVQVSRGRENWAREFANERVHHSPIDDQWVDEFHKLPSL
ncbi:hypothetical protein Tco_0574277 [Tanacetum coccineum]